jgi:hypothetical protein
MMPSVISAVPATGSSYVSKPGSGRNVPHQTDYDSFVDHEPFKDLGPYRSHITSYDATLRGLLAARIQP